MALPFDHIASTYDPALMQSAVGQLQRKQVWAYLESVIPQLYGFEMLELTYGTGEDSLLFGEGGFNIVATDITEETQKVTYKKAEQFSMQHRISSHYLDLESFNETLFDKKFDLIFSNFGGLNCVNPQSFKRLLQNIPFLLNPGGRFIGVIMPKFCAWETIFFLFRFKFRKAFRRFTSKEFITSEQHADLKTWFYNPSQIKKWSKEKFQLITLKPIGLVLPSVYLEKFVSFKKQWLLRLNKLEKKLNDSTFFSGMADNFIIDLKLL